MDWETEPSKLKHSKYFSDSRSAQHSEQISRSEQTTGMVRTVSATLPNTSCLLYLNTHLTAGYTAFAGQSKGCQNEQMATARAAPLCSPCVAALIYSMAARERRGNDAAHPRQRRTAPHPFSKHLLNLLRWAKVRTHTVLTHFLPADTSRSCFSPEGGNIKTPP